MVSTAGLLLAITAWFGTILPQVSAQCANNVAIHHPKERTLTSNSTWMIIPVPKAAVETALKQSYPLQKLSLLDVPTTDSTLFPNGFPAGFHPVVATIGLQDDIRMTALQIDGGLKTGAVSAAYVSQNGDPTPLSASLVNYIAGETGPLPNGLVPAVASPLLFGGAPIRLGQFRPEKDAYMADAGGTLSTQAKWAVLINEISGPGFYPEAADFEVKIQASAEKYTAKTFKTLINQPQILPPGMCQRNQYYFTNATALTNFVAGDVTLGPGASGIGVFSGVLEEASPDGSGKYTDVEGFTGCA